MKKTTLAALAITALAITPSSAEDIAIAPHKLPKAAQNLLNSYFPSKRVVLAIHDNDFKDNDYAVTLSDGTHIEFNSRGRWESIENKEGSFPSGIIPEKSNNFVSEYYPTVQIIKIERKPYGYEMELSNELDLKFDSTGKMIGVEE